MRLKAPFFKGQNMEVKGSQVPKDFMEHSSHSSSGLWPKHIFPDTVPREERQLAWIPTRACFEIYLERPAFSLGVAVSQRATPSPPRHHFIGGGK